MGQGLKRAAMVARSVSLVAAMLLGQQSRAATSLYWNADGDYYNNNMATGAGLGGSGLWGNSYFVNSTSTSPATFDNTFKYDVVFWGTAGNVALDSVKWPGSLTIKTDGYTFSGAGIFFDTGTRGEIDVQTGTTSLNNDVTTASPSIALSKFGAGTLAIDSGTINAPMFVSAGVVSINNSARLGSLSHTITLSGGTLRSTQAAGPTVTAFMSSNHPLALTAAGGTIDVTSGPLAYGGTMTATLGATLTKTGAGDFTYTGSPGAMQSRLRVTGGFYSSFWGPVRSFVGVPVADLVTLDGGGLSGTQGTEENQGILIASGGGTLRTAGSLGYRGPISGAGALNITRTANVSAFSSYVWLMNTTSTFTGPINVTSSQLIADSAGDASATAPITLDGSRLANSAYADLYAPLRPVIVAAGGAQLTNLRTMTLAGISGPGNLSKPFNNGSVVTNHIRVNDLSLAAGSVAIKPGGGAGGVSHVHAIDITTAQLDLKDNAVVIDAADVSGVEAMVGSGRNGGSWDGFGIVTTMTDATSPHARTTLGTARAGDALNLQSNQTTTWSGQTVGADAVIVMYTLSGDANLDGMVDADDYFNLDSGFASQQQASYFNGDLDYNGRIDADDYFILDRGYHTSGDAFAGVSAVPEPGTAAMLTATALGLLRRRRAAR